MYHTTLLRQFIVSYHVKDTYRMYRRALTGVCVEWISLREYLTNCKAHTSVLYLAHTSVCSHASGTAFADVIIEKARARLVCSLVETKKKKKENSFWTNEACSIIVQPLPIWTFSCSPDAETLDAVISASVFKCIHADGAKLLYNNDAVNTMA